MITDAQVKALLTLVEYTAKKVVEIRTEVTKIRRSQTRRERQDKRLVKVLADNMTLKQQLQEALKFQ